MNTFLTNLLNNGTLPTVNVNVTIDNNTLLKLAGVLLTVTIIASLFHLAISKHSK